MSEGLMDRFAPWYAALVVDNPEEWEERLTEKLEAYLNEAAPLEDSQGRRARITLLEKLRDMLNAWVLRKLEEKNVVFEGDSESELAGRVFVSGSYRLGVSGKGSDIDSICVIPTPLTREEFFDEEDGMLAMLRKRSEVSYVNPVIARVPIIEVVWDGIDLDVQCCVVPKQRVPQRPEELLDDQILKGMDEKSQLCINGPRVTELVIRLVPDVNTYSVLLRCVRLWFKKRGMYSNKIGFLGGVNFAILCAFVCQLFPSAAPARLLLEFFQLYRVWRWPTEIRLCHAYFPEGLDEKQWESRGTGEVMPIITPAYPSMNSSFNVTKYNLRIMSNEFARGERFCRVLHNKMKKGKPVEPSDWAPLFAESDFFVRFSTYLVLKASAKDDHNLNRWSGWVEARIRRIFEELDRFSMQEIYPFPKKFSHDGVSLSFPGFPNEQAQQVDGEEKPAPSCYWYIGLRAHPINSVRTGANVDMTSAVALWCNAVKKWPEKEDDMDLHVSLCKWKSLPDDPEMFPHGKETYKSAHKQCMDQIKKENAMIRKQVLGVVDKPESNTSAANSSSTTDLEQNDQPTETSNDSNKKEMGDVKQELDSKTGVVKPEEEDDQVDAKEDKAIERMQDLLGKRTREEKEASDALTKTRNISSSNFFELPTFGGINTIKPLKVSR